MAWRFEIENIFMISGRNQVCIVTKILEGEEKGHLTDQSTLCGAAIEKQFSIPTAKDEGGNPRHGLYAFFLRNAEDRNKFVEGQIVELIL